MYIIIILINTHAGLIILVNEIYVLVLEGGYMFF